MRPLNKRQLLAQKWMFKTDDSFLPVWTEKYPRLEAALEGIFYRWPCHLLKAHYAIVDQCGIPAHDYCAWCQKRMPNQAERTVK